MRAAAVLPCAPYLLVAGVAGLTLGGCVDAEASLPEIEVTQPGIAFDAFAYPPGVVLEPTLSFGFALDTAKLGASTKVENQQKIDALEVWDIQFVPRTGVDELTFVRHLTVTARAPGDPGPDTLIVDYERPAGPLPRILHATPAKPVDILPLWRPKPGQERKVYITVMVTGELPEVPWTVDGVFSLSASLHN